MLGHLGCLLGLGKINMATVSSVRLRAAAGMRRMRSLLRPLRFRRGKKKNRDDFVYHGLFQRRNLSFDERAVVFFGDA